MSTIIPFSSVINRSGQLLANKIDLNNVDPEEFEKMIADLPCVKDTRESMSNSRRILRNSLARYSVRTNRSN